MSLTKLFSFITYISHDLLKNIHLIFSYGIHDSFIAKIFLFIFKAFLLDLDLVLLALFSMKSRIKS